MPHSLIVGVTGCGKSRLLRELIVPGWRRRGHAVLVYDPIAPIPERWPGAYWITKDPRKLLEKAHESEKCIIVIDEARNLRKDHDLEKDAAWLATEARNRGHRCYFVGQRVIHISPDMRGNCIEAWAFQQHPKDAKLIAEEMNLPAIESVLPNLPLGICMRLAPGKPPVKYRVF